MEIRFSFFLLIFSAPYLGCAANVQRPGFQEQPLANGDQ
jgi:hypothetical protein